MGVGDGWVEGVCDLDFGRIWIGMTVPSEVSTGMSSVGLGAVDFWTGISITCAGDIGEVRGKGELIEDAGGGVGNITGAGTGDITGVSTGDIIEASIGDITGAGTGDITGDITGAGTGDITGDIIGTGTGDVTGDTTDDATWSDVGVINGVVIEEGAKVGCDSGIWGGLYPNDFKGLIVGREKYKFGFSAVSLMDLKTVLLSAGVSCFSLSGILHAYDVDV